MKSLLLLAAATFFIWTSGPLSAQQNADGSPGQNNNSSEKPDVHPADCPAQSGKTADSQNEETAGCTNKAVSDEKQEDTPTAAGGGVLGSGVAVPVIGFASPFVPAVGPASMGSEAVSPSMIKPAVSEAPSSSITSDTTSDTAIIRKATQRAIENYHGGIVQDWSTHRVIFSNPGSEEDAIRQGKYDQWLHIANDRRYQMQMIRRNYVGPQAVQTAPAAQNASNQANSAGARLVKGKDLHAIAAPEPPDEGAWTFALSGTTGNSTAIDMYPAKFSYDQQNASCSDYVVFPVNAAGVSGSQANIVGVTNMYVGGGATTGMTPLCSGSPTALFAYYVGTGKVQTSPAIALAGNKIAFVETVSNASRFHVVTIGTTGTNGTATAPVAPGSAGGNNGVDAPLLITNATNPTGATSSRSSPFMDWDNDVAYVGDDNGYIHKFTGVFNGTLAEAGSPWPVQVTTDPLNSPVYDGAVTHNIYAVPYTNATRNNVYCVQSSGSLCSTPSVSIDGTSNSPILEGPIIDQARQTIFVQKNGQVNISTPPSAMVFETNTTFSFTTAVNIGAFGNNQYDGAFDQKYYSNSTLTSGHLWVCGNLPSTTTLQPAALVSISFDATGKMTTVSSPFQLMTTGNGGNGNCSPITENYNPNNSKDLLFVTISNHGFTAKCTDKACVLAFDVTSGALPTTASAVRTVPSYVGTGTGTSGIITDGYSTAVGATQIYFGNPDSSVGAQLSQSGTN